MAKTLHGAALKAHQKKQRAKGKRKHPKKDKRSTHSGHAKRSSAKRPTHSHKGGHAHRCPMCGHAAKHGPAGCTHFEGSRFCSCKHRG
jgi:hypothetical protein